MPTHVTQERSEDGRGDQVRKYRGCLALCFAHDSPVLAQLEHMLTTQQQQLQESGAIPFAFERLPTDQWHVTLVTKAELKDLSEDAIAEANALMPSRVFPIGLGGSVTHPNVCFIVCVWPKAQAFRKKHGLPLKDFHVSASVQNNHKIDKTVSALLDTSSSWMDELSMEALEAVTRQLLQEGGGKHTYALHVATHLCSKYGTRTTRGWLRLGDAALQLQQFKLAMLSFAHACEALEASGEDRAMQRFCLTRMTVCSHTTEWGHLFLESEVQEIPASLAPFLLNRRWSSTLCSAIRDCAEPTDRSYTPREKLWTLANRPAPGRSPFYRLPRFFRWIVPFQLATMSTPRNEDDIVHLAESIGIRHIVTLTKEQPLESHWFPKLPNLIKNTLLPVENYEPPTLAQIDLFMKICCGASGSSSASGSEPPVVLVHCGGGKGRAGVMVACYLVAFGFNSPPSALEGWIQPAMSADEAIRALRAIRPGSIETERQEATVSSYSSLLWKRRSVLPVPVDEPMVSKPIITGNSPLEKTDLLVLCGLPGSGKTTFRQMLIKRSSGSVSGGKHQSAPRWLELSGDEHGREGCERSIGQLKSGARAILDRVNGKKEDRKAFLQLASTWSKHATAVWFDFETELCVYRAQQRPNHPTLPPGRRVENAIEQHTQEFTQPELSEGFQSVVRVTSIQAARELAELLSPPIGLLRFPRTSHVINLGAATDDDLVWEGPVPPATCGKEATAARSSIEASSSDGQQQLIVVTEKLDGANLGISLAADGCALVVQNRSHYVNSKSHTQFRKLDAFLDAHRRALRTILLQDALFPERFILYGEWLAATHSIAYTNLQDLFYAFDLYDRELDRFWDRQALEVLLKVANPLGFDTYGERIQIAPKLWSGSKLPDNEELVRMARETRSQFFDGVIEGLYIKWEAPGYGVRHRGKIVRGDFMAGNEHWTKGAIRFNTVVPTSKSLSGLE